MTIEQIVNELEKVGLPLTYYEFPDEEETPSLPFLVYFEVGTENFFADGKTYERITRLAIEFYFKEKDFELQNRIEDALTNCGPWNCEGEEKLDSENCFERVYYLEV